MLGVSVASTAMQRRGQSSLLGRLLLSSSSASTQSTVSSLSFTASSSSIIVAQCRYHSTTAAPTSSTSDGQQNASGSTGDGWAGRGRGGRGGGRGRGRGGGDYNRNNNSNNNNRNYNNNQARHHNHGHHHHQNTTIQPVIGPREVTPDQLPDDLKLLEAELTKKYGPLSQLQTRFDRRGQRFKAQATFRQCGFAVELATAAGPTAIDAAKAVLIQALALDIMFIDPRIRVATASNLVAHTKGTFDELRTLCTNAGRMIKFSVVPAAQQQQHASSEDGTLGCEGTDVVGSSNVGTCDSNSINSNMNDNNNHVSVEQEGRGVVGATPASNKKKWAVRSYVRDDWEAVSQLLPLVEIIDESANKALNDNVFQILESYRAEFSSPEVVKEDYLELSRHLKAFKELELSEMSTEDVAMRTFTVNVQVTDPIGNAYKVQSKGNRGLNGAYTNVAKAIFKIESDQSASQRPLIAQMRWQVDAMCLAVYGSTAVYHEEKAANALHGQLFVDKPYEGLEPLFKETPVTTAEGQQPAATNNNSNNDNKTAENVSVLRSNIDNAAAAAYGEKNYFSLYSGRVLSECTGQGSYLIEFKCYTTALKTLLREYPQVAASNKSLPFLREADLDEAVERHNNFDILGIHKGKWTPFACLGTITSTLIGSSFHSDFEDVPEGLHISTRAILSVNDGERYSRNLTSRLSKDKVDAWRTACSDAIRDNFPRQHEQLLKSDEYAQSISRTEGMTSKHKDLSRDRRAPHFSNLFSMLQSFAQEDFMWTQMQLIAVQNSASQQWVGEIHVLEAGKSKCIYQSEQFSTSKMARKVACYAVAMKHYPKETQIYIGLNRGDYVASDREFLDKILSRTYDSRRPLTQQLCELIEKNQPNLKPVTWRLEAMDATGRQRATVLSKETAPIVDVAGEPLETPVSTLQRALIAACKATRTPHEKLMEEYLMTSPPIVNGERDLASYLFVSFLGKLPEVSSIFVNQMWVQTVTVELDNGHRVMLHRSEHISKKEGTIHAYLLAAKHSFPQLLKNIAATPCDMRDIAVAMLARSGSQITLDGRLVTESEVLAATTGTSDTSGATTMGGNGATLEDAEGAHATTKETVNAPSATSTTNTPSAATPAGGIQPVSRAAIFLNKCVSEFDKGYVLTTKLEVLSNGSTKATLTRSDAAKRQFEEAGVGLGKTPNEALHEAALAVLENLFDTHMAEELERDPELCEFSSAPSSSTTE